MPDRLGPQQRQEKAPRSPPTELPDETDDAHQGQRAQHKSVEGQAVPQVSEPVAETEPAHFQSGRVGKPGVEVEATKREQSDEGRPRRQREPTERPELVAEAVLPRG